MKNLTILQMMVTIVIGGASSIAAQASNVQANSSSAAARPGVISGRATVAPTRPQVISGTMKQSQVLKLQSGNKIFGKRRQ